ncbi:MAG: (deoxy)nucleoside triphosphate pyrophosphohydrolase [Armatimonadetes bacterium]|nr:(deoxy)nucleoside triphosphate pyrophosphohydrolase [Armatimonadota bacterium]
MSDSNGSISNAQANYKPRPQLPTEYAAVGIIEREGSVLVARRKRGAFLGGYWEFPGGKRKPGESYAQCVVREVLEETGLNVEVVRELLPVRFEYKNKRIILQPYLCRVISGTAQALDSDAIQWMPLRELKSLKMPEANAEIIKRLLTGEYEI